MIGVLALVASSWNLYSLGERVDDQHRSPMPAELVVGWGALGLSAAIAICALIVLVARGLPDNLTSPRTRR